MVVVVVSKCEFSVRLWPKPRPWHVDLGPSWSIWCYDVTQTNTTCHNPECHHPDEHTADRLYPRLDLTETWRNPGLTEHRQNITQTVFLLKVPFLLWTLSNCMQCKISANKLGLSLAKLSYHLGFGCTMIKINEWWILTRLTATNHFIPMRMSTYNEQTVWVKSNLWFIKSGLSLVWDEDSQSCSFCGVLQGFLVRNWLWWPQRANQICMKHSHRPTS